MSFSALSAVIDNGHQERLIGAKVSERCILMLLAYRHNQDTGKCCPKIKRIAIETGLSVRAVISNLNLLEKRGVLIRRPQMRGGKTVGMQYDLNVDPVMDQPKRGAESACLMVQNIPVNDADSAPPLRTEIEKEVRTKSGNMRRQSPPSWEISAYKIPDTMPFDTTVQGSDGYKVSMALQDWLDFRRGSPNRAYQASGWLTEIWNRVDKDPKRLVAAVQVSIAREWHGIYEDRNGKSQRHAAPAKVDPARRKIQTRRTS